MRRNQPEKIIQAQIVTLLRSIGAQVYVLGTRRPRGDHPGTCQTPGLPDLYVVLPPAPIDTAEAWNGATPLPVWIEVKAPEGRVSPAQRRFAELCRVSRTPHLVGGVDYVIGWLMAGGWLKAENVPHYRRPPAALEVLR